MKHARAVVLVDVVVGSVLLGVALAALLGLVGRAVNTEVRGEQFRIVSMLLDERLNLVLMHGPDDYATRFGTSGRCDAPFGDYAYRLEIVGGTGGAAYRVRATISWESGSTELSESIETRIAPRRAPSGLEPDPDRKPTRPVERFG
ncbi:MAG: hypothetical protein JNM07_05300 [Phycisphaerae bacterium]|nr:hypothetical protein [Phycisphaerae bacterium]